MSSPALAFPPTAGQGFGMEPFSSSAAGQDFGMEPFSSSAAGRGFGMEPFVHLFSFVLFAGVFLFGSYVFQKVVCPSGPVLLARFDPYRAVLGTLNFLDFLQSLSSSWCSLLMPSTSGTQSSSVRLSAILSQYSSLILRYSAIRIPTLSRKFLSG